LLFSSPRGSKTTTSLFRRKKKKKKQKKERSRVLSFFLVFLCRRLVEPTIEKNSEKKKNFISLRTFF